MQEKTQLNTTAYSGFVFKHHCEGKFITHQWKREKRVNINTRRLQKLLKFLHTKYHPLIRPPLFVSNQIEVRKRIFGSKNSECISSVRHFHEYDYDEYTVVSIAIFSHFSLMHLLLSCHICVARSERERESEQEVTKTESPTLSYHNDRYLIHIFTEIRALKSERIKKPSWTYTCHQWHSLFRIKSFQNRRKNIEFHSENLWHVYTQKQNKKNGEVWRRAHV